LDEATLSSLLPRVARGDEEAMQGLFEECRGPLTRFLFRLCRSPEQAEDLVQETFLRIWRYRAGFRGTGKAKSWIYRVALNEWRHSFKKIMKRDGMSEELVEDPEDRNAVRPEDGLVGEEVGAQVRAAIEGLPEEQRTTFILHRFEGLSCREIAEVDGTSRKTVESRLRLALEKLTWKLRKLEEPA
jgi:RNA polymerase sigma-70 factor (ECF subfamily)